MGASREDKNIKRKGLNGEIFNKEEIDYFFKKYGIEGRFTNVFKQKVIRFFYHEDDRIVKYIDRVGEKDFSFKRFKKFLVFKNENPCVSSGKEFCLKLYGKERGAKEFKDWKNKQFFVYQYDKELMSKVKGISSENAKKEIEENKKKSATNKETFIRKYGEEIGERKYKEFCKSSASSNLESYIKRYGSESVGKREYTKRWNKHSFNLSLDGYKERFGKIKGKKKYNELIELKSYYSSFDGMKQELGIEAAIEIKRRRGLIFSDTEQYFSDKGLIGDELKAAVKNLRLKQRNEVKGDLKKVISLIEEIEYFKSLKIDKKQASLSSLRYFLPLIEELCNKGFERDDFVLGFGGQKEFTIKTEEKLFRYDFLIYSKNLIIEFDGVGVHPPKELTTNKSLKKRKNIFGDDGLSIRNRDKLKQKAAEERGYTVLRIDETSDFLELLKVIENFAG